MKSLQIKNNKIDILFLLNINEKYFKEIYFLSLKKSYYYHKKNPILFEKYGISNDF
jgi:hypothetical protein